MLRARGINLESYDSASGDESKVKNKKWHLQQKKAMRLFQQYRTLLGLLMIGVLAVLAWSYGQLPPSSSPSQLTSASSARMNDDMARRHGGHNGNGQQGGHYQQQQRRRRQQEEQHENHGPRQALRRVKFGNDPRDRHCDLESVRESEQEGLHQCADAMPYYRQVEPEEGWLHDIDFYFRRNRNKLREHCYVRCLEMIFRRDEETIGNDWLIDAAMLGLPKVVETLMENPGLNLNPLRSPGNGRLNAIQQAIRGGYAEIVKILTNANYDLIIDQHGRSVRDYINLKGSPIVPRDAREILGINVQLPPEPVVDQRQASEVHYNDEHSGWSHTTNFYYNDAKCDIDVLTSITKEEFFKNYYLPGRPFVLKNFVPKVELDAFTKDRWDSTEEYDIHKKKWRVGPTAYPSLTDQEHCTERMTILELEDKKECREMPGIPMEVAWHPNEEDFKDLWPMYTMEEIYKKSGWRKMEEWFGPRGDYGDHLAWQVFFGGDGSGATYHWHGPAFNNLYVGTKQWRVSPPIYRGFTGMPARDAQRMLDHQEAPIMMGCVQHAGDMMYIPENWGHSTLTHAFTIGSAVIMPEEYHQPPRNM